MNMNIHLNSNVDERSRCAPTRRSGLAVIGVCQLCGGCGVAEISL